LPDRFQQRQGFFRLTENPCRDALFDQKSPRSVFGFVDRRLALAFQFEERAHHGRPSKDCRIIVKYVVKPVVVWL
jgi:hypothetical protein